MMDNEFCDFLEIDADGVDNGILLNGDNTWTNIQSVPVKSIPCIIKDDLLSKLIKIENKITARTHKSLEFGCYVKGKISNGKLIVDEENIYIPKQSVTSASIEFKEEVPDSSYNGVIHRHPNGCLQFSGVDDKYINSNFQFSLLFVQRTVRCGIINVMTDFGLKIQVPLDIIVISDDSDINIDGITEKIPVALLNTKGSDDIQPLPIMSLFNGKANEF